jgi:chemotaxis protein histidine kinase CheA
MSADFANLLAEMQADFIDELPERCARLEERVMAMERKEPDAFDELYRQIHSLKGSGGTFGLPLVSAICHQFESFIGEKRTSFTKRVTTSALAYVDLLRKAAGAAAKGELTATGLEQSLEQLRLSGLSGRAAVLAVDPSAAMRKLYQKVFADMAVSLVTLDRGLTALERMLYQPFDLLVASRELPDLSATALTAALRESGGRNAGIPVILISSNPAPLPKHLQVQGMIKRDPKLADTLTKYSTACLAKARR